MRILKLKFTGTKSMIMNNGRLSNPLDSYAIKKKQLCAKKKKTDEDYANIALVEARGGAYETKEGLLGLPTTNIFASFFNAAKSKKLGKELKKALKEITLITPILIGGKEIKVDDYVKSLDQDKVLLMIVRQGQKRILRARILIPEGWTSEGHIFELDEKIMDFREFIDIVHYAEEYICLMDWRPKYGAYKTEIQNGTT